MKRKLLLAIAILLAILAVACDARKASTDGARKAWKDEAIIRIQKSVEDSMRLEAELARLKAVVSTNGPASDNWFSTQLILMRNGEWISYAAVCQKENPKVEDLFLGRGSDGKWYYSTFHFCVGMLNLDLDEQAESLNQFAKKYFLREFDGHSDECLRKTRPPE